MNHIEHVLLIVFKQNGIKPWKFFIRTKEHPSSFYIYFLCHALGISLLGFDIHKGMNCLFVCFKMFPMS